MKTTTALLALVLTGLTLSYAADSASDGKGKTITYRAAAPNQLFDNSGNATPSNVHPEKIPAAFEQYEIVEGVGGAARTFSGKVVVDGPMDGVEVGLVSLVNIHWNVPDAYQWQPVAADGSFSITDKNHLDASKAISVRGPNTAWTFLHYNFTSQQGAKDIVLTAVPSKKIHLTASAADMVDLDKVAFEPFDATNPTDADGRGLYLQQYGYLKTGDQKYLDVMLPVGEIAIYVHRGGFADYYQVVDTTKADHIHFILRKAGRMKITVLDAEGKPKNAVPVSWNNPAAYLSFWEVKTNASGVNYADHLVPGTFVLNVAGFDKNEVEVKEDMVTEITYQDGKPPTVPVFSKVPPKPPEPKPAGK